MIPGFREVDLRRGQGRLHASRSRRCSTAASFVNVGERTNVTGSARFKKLIIAGRLCTPRRGRAPAGRERRAGHRRQHGRGPARRRAAMDDVPELIAAEPDIARVPVMIDSSKWR
jgi:5-methyltetrahydrofolate--homocysteine methyltransferase